MASFAVMELAFHYLLEPAARMVEGIVPKALRTACLALLLVFTADCVLSALFRAPITY